jgi:rhamnose utilization protein RhaD (predicted bifunctional aldolase and dehydrogenase)
MTDLEIIVELSHEFGTEDYVKGGGGNTSVKDETTLWVKPSGTTLGGLTVDTFVAMNRAKINELYEVETPKEAAAREELVKNMMAESVENDAGRPSVEAPLHNVFEAKYVVHTHPALVNGLTCAKEGKAACERLFPDALWVEYIDPGYTLCMEVRERIEAYKGEKGCEPALLFLQNHGVFIAADTAEDIRALYWQVMDALMGEYEMAGIALELPVDENPVTEGKEECFQALFGDDAAYVVSSGLFGYVPGPVTPDHLVYSKAFPYSGSFSAEDAAEYRAERGYNYMTDAQREFIENWEVESYRSKQV